MDRGAKFDVGGGGGGGGRRGEEGDPHACKVSVSWQQGPGKSLGHVSADIAFLTDEGNSMIYECQCSFLWTDAKICLLQTLNCY